MHNGSSERQKRTYTHGLRQGSIGSVMYMCIQICMLCGGLFLVYTPASSMPTYHFDPGRVDNSSVGVAPT